MKLQAVEASLDVTHGGGRTVIGTAENLEAFGNTTHEIAVAHPDTLGRLQTGEHTRSGGDFQCCGAEFHTIPRLHLAPEAVAQQLVAVAQSENGKSRVEDRCLEGRPVIGVYAGRPAGQNETVGVAQVVQGCVRWPDLGPHVQAPKPVGDEMGVLTAEVEDDDAQRNAPPGRGWMKWWFARVVIYAGTATAATGAGCRSACRQIR